MHQELDQTLWFVVWKGPNFIGYLSGTFQEILEKCTQKFGQPIFILDGCGFTRPDGCHVIRLGYCEEYLKRYKDHL